MLKDERALEPLRALAKTATDQGLLGEVAWALGRFEPQQVKPALLGIYGRTMGGGPARRQVAAALAALGDPTVTSVLFEQMRSSYDDTVQALSLAGPVPTGTLDALDPESVSLDCARVLAKRPQCDALGLLTRASLVPASNGSYPSALANTLTDGILTDLPQGCVKPLREQIAEAATGPRGEILVPLLAAYATPSDLELLRRLARSKRGETAAAADQTLHRLGSPLGPDASAGSALAYASVLDETWPNRLWSEVSKPSFDLAAAARGVEERRYQWLVATLEGSGKDAATYTLAPGLVESELVDLASTRPTLTGLLGLARPNGPRLLLSALAAPHARFDAEALRATLAMLDMRTVIELSRAAPANTKELFVRWIAERADTDADARDETRRSLRAPDSAMQKAILRAVAEKTASLALSELAPLTTVADEKLQLATFEAIAASATPDDATPLALATLQPALGARSSWLRALAAVDTASAERQLLTDLAAQDPKLRGAAEQALASGGLDRAVSPSILAAISDPKYPRARPALLAGARHVRSADLWALLHRPEDDSERRGFLSATRDGDRASVAATTRALANLVMDYAPDPIAAPVVKARAASLVALVGSEPLPDRERGALARGLVRWLGSDEQHGPALAQVLLTRGLSDVIDVLGLQPTDATLTALLDAPPSELTSRAQTSALEAAVFERALGPFLARAADPASSLRKRLGDWQLATAAIRPEAARAPALRAPLRALLGASSASDDAVAVKLKYFAISVIARAKDAEYLPPLKEALASEPNLQFQALLRTAIALCAGEPHYGELFDAIEQLRDRYGSTAPARPLTEDQSLPPGLAVAATFAPGFDATNVERLLATRKDPQLAALLPRLEHEPAAFATWLEAAQERGVTLPASTLTLVMRDPAPKASIAAARLLAARADRSDLGGVLQTLCLAASDALNAARIAFDLRAYTLDDLATGSRSELAAVRACSLRLLARRGDPKLGQRLLAATFDAHPEVRKTALQLALPRKDPALGARARTMLSEWTSREHLPWLLAVWLETAPPAAVERLVTLEKTIDDLLEPCGYWLPVAAAAPQLIRARVRSLFGQLEGTYCRLGSAVSLALSGPELLSFYTRLDLSEQAQVRARLLGSELTFDPSYVPLLERFATDRSGSDTADPTLLRHVLEMPSATAKDLLRRVLLPRVVDEPSRVLLSQLAAGL